MKGLHSRATVSQSEGNMKQDRAGKQADLSALEDHRRKLVFGRKEYSVSGSF
jgi:hypothetical protein